MSVQAEADFMAFDLETGNCIGGWNGNAYADIRRIVGDYIAEGQDWSQVAVLDVRSGLPGVEVPIDGTAVTETTVA